MWVLHLHSSHSQSYNLKRTSILATQRGSTTWAVDASTLRKGNVSGQQMTHAPHIQVPIRESVRGLRFPSPKSETMRIFPHLSIAMQCSNHSGTHTTLYIFP